MPITPELCASTVALEETIVVQKPSRGRRRLRTVGEAAQFLSDQFSPDHFETGIGYELVVLLLYVSRRENDSIRERTSDALERFLGRHGFLVDEL